MAENNEARAESEYITIKILNTLNETRQCKMKKDKPMGKLVKAYCKSTNSCIYDTRFIVGFDRPDEQRIYFDTSSTPNSLGMKEGDTIFTYQALRG